MKFFKILFLFSFLFVMSATSCTDSGGEGGPTVLLQGVPQGVFEVGSVISITVSAEGADGGDLEFDYDWKPKSEKWTVKERANFLTQSKTALFSWDPLASDATKGVPIQLIFIVRDESGRRTEKTASIEIVAGNGKPVFSSNVSEIFDPRTGKGLSFEVKVKDQDSAEVDIQMDEATAPIGARFEKTGPYTGQFTWEPSANQLDKRIRTVRFIADDSQFEKVNHDVTIVVRNNQTVDLDKDQTKASCPDAEIITHSPLGSQRSLEDYKVEAKIAAGSRFDEVILFWTRADAYNADFDDKDEKGKLISVPMIEEGGVYTADIRSQAGFISDQGYADISYQICGIDKQAQGAGAIICSPSSGDLEMFYSFIAYPDEGMCVDDALDGVGGSGDDEIATAYVADDKWETRHICSSSSDFFSVKSQPGEKSFIGVTFNHEDPNLTLKALDKNGDELPLDVSACTGLVTLDTSVPMGGSATDFYIELSGNEAAYHVRKFTISTGNAGECNDAAREPNEDALNANEIQAGDSFDAEICKDGDIDVYKINLEGGDVISVTHTFTSADGNLDMTLFSPEQVDDVGNTGGGGVAFTFAFDKDSETIEYTALSSGPYYLQVFNNNPSKNPYHLDVQVQAAPPCDMDEFENGNNHSQSNAALLTSADSQMFSNLEVCPGKADWYKRTEFKDVFVLGEVKVTGGDGTINDVKWEIFDLQQNLIGSATVNGPALELSFTPASTSGVFHKISTTSQVNYSFELLR